MKLIAILFLCLTLLSPFSATAELPKQLLADFAPIDGAIIMPIGDEYLVDLDASSNLLEGDILTLVASGERVIHPITKEILGSLDVPKGFLQITRIKSGYSYAKLLTSAEPTVKGDKIRRFEQVPSLFVDKQGDSGQLFSDLKTGLPQLNWLTETSTKEPLLFFTLENNKLTVKTTADITLSTYSMSKTGPVATPRPRNQPLPFKVRKEPRNIIEKTANTIINSLSSTSSFDEPGTAGIIHSGQQHEGYWIGPNMDGHPVGIVVADLDGDGQQEIAMAVNKKIYISQIVNGQHQLEAEIALPIGVALLSLDAIDLDQNGLPELYATATADHKLKSVVFEFIDSDYQKTLSNLPWFLRVVELPAEGRILLGQKLGDEADPFIASPVRLKRQGDQLTAGDELSLPLHANIFSFSLFSDADGNSYYAYLSETNQLVIANADGAEVWESGDFIGGTESYLEILPILKDDLAVPVHIRPRILHTANGEILVIQNDGGAIFKRFEEFKSSRLLALTWNGQTIQENWRTSSQNGYLADFIIADYDNDGIDELIMAVKFKHKGLLQGARSAIVAYDLN